MILGMPQLRNMTINQPIKTFLRSSCLNSAITKKRANDKITYMKMGKKDSLSKNNPIFELNKSRLSERIKNSKTGIPKIKKPTAVSPSQVNRFFFMLLIC